MKLTKIIGFNVMKGYSILRKNIFYGTRNIYITSTKRNTIKNNDLQNYTLPISKRLLHSEENNDEDDLSSDFENVYSELYQQPQSIKDTIYPNTTDLLMKKLNNCASLQDILDFLNSHCDKLNTEHVTQMVLVLWDLQKMFYHISLSRSFSDIDASKFDQLSENYIKALKEDEICKKLWELLKNKQSDFSIEQLSYILLYLNKMGISHKENIMQMLISNFLSKFKESVSFPALARFLTSIYSRADLSFYYYAQDFIPIIIDNIDDCKVLTELHAITSCLNHLNPVLTDDTLMKYKKKVVEFLKADAIGSSDHKIILNIILLLNFPHWREKNVTLIIQCLLLLKNQMHMLKVNELLVVNEVFQKIQEPADLLNEIQRCASKFLLELEEEMSPQLDIRLKLFSCVIYFASPSQRPHFKKVIQKYIDYNLDGTSLLELHRIILFTKMSDVAVCNKYWRKMVSCLRNRNFRDSNLLRVCQNYIDFNEDISDHRCLEFEEKVMNYLEHELRHGLLGLLPMRFSILASFLLIYSRNREVLDIVIGRIADFAKYFNPVDCLNISRGVQIALQQNKLLGRSHMISLKNSLDKCIDHCIQYKCGANKINLLIKSYVYVNKFDENLFHLLSESYRKDPVLYSVHIKNTLYNLFITSSLLPDVMNIITDYIIQHKNDILGFNAERMVYLCFYLGYLPKNAEKFFQVVTDIFLRDQERMSGLSYLQACLALCFYHSLPQSFIQQIFNVEFLEKLDVELSNCYFKDVYPLRVRHSMMQLNRAVCLDCPELNTPWFHQKYTDESQKKAFTEKKSELHNSIKECLLEITKHEDCINENETTPYGYSIDFTVYLDGNSKLTNAINSTQRIAILLIKPNFYTKIHKQLKGFYQMKMRHLEILGYKVKLINTQEWRKLEYMEDKMNYLINIIKSEELYSNLIQELSKKR